MIRFSASEEEITGLLRFMERRARTLFRTGSGLLFVPLVSGTAATPRPRRTARTLKYLLRDTNTVQFWGVRLQSDAAHPYTAKRNAETGKYILDTEASRLILLALGTVQSSADSTERRREGLLELRDWVEEPAPEPVAEGVPAAKGVVFLPQSLAARDLVERCVRRLRRRGSLVASRWHVPPGLPEDDAA